MGDFKMEFAATGRGTGREIKAKIINLFDLKSIKANEEVKNANENSHQNEKGIEISIGCATSSFGKCSICSIRAGWCAEHAHSPVVLSKTILFISRRHYLDAAVSKPFPSYYKTNGIKLCVGCCVTAVMLPERLIRCSTLISLAVYLSMRMCLCMCRNFIVACIVVRTALPQNVQNTSHFLYCFETHTHTHNILKQ